jgi:uncharacterized protein YndB with AHSA1/START domain
MEPLELSFTVGCPPEHAFAVWTERTSLWWPASHSVSADPGLTVTFEPRAGGRIFERTAAGDEHDWGQILEWDPPRRLAYRWHLRQDRADATRVEISFAPSDEGTVVTIVHSDWQRLGQRERNVKGWAGLVPHFVAACSASEPRRALRARPPGRARRSRRA